MNTRRDYSSGRTRACALALIACATVVSLRCAPTPPPGGGGGTAGAPDASLPGAPLTATLEQWTWIPIQGMECGNGGPTGIGVNLTERSRDLLVFFEGGGACWSGATCWGLPMSLYVTSGYGPAEFDKDFQRNLLPLQRENEKNPFRNMSYVFVPYCTGDFHAGDRIAHYPGLLPGTENETHHVGGRNLEIALRSIVATFATAPNVWLAGDSAGGYSVVLNFGRFKAAFPRAQLGILDDSGPPIQPRADLWQAWKDAWNLRPPIDCPECDARLPAYVDYNHRLSPDTPFGLASYTKDTSIQSYFGLDQSAFTAALNALTTHMNELSPRYKYYLREGASHITLIDLRDFDAGYPPPPDDVYRWLTQMVERDPEWSNVTP